MGEALMHGQSISQSQAQMLAEQVAGEMGAKLDVWVKSQAQEWTRTVMTTKDGKTVRLSASTGGVLSVEGDPFTPSERLLNTTKEAVTVSIQAGVNNALVPLAPIKTDAVFVDCGGELGVAWRDVCDEENRLAGYLTRLKDGQAVVLASKVWFLNKIDGQMVLMHGILVGKEIKNKTSRFDFGLDYVDVDIEELGDYLVWVRSVADDLLYGFCLEVDDVCCGDGVVPGQKPMIVSGLLGVD